MLFQLEFQNLQMVQSMVPSHVGAIKFPRSGNQSRNSAERSISTGIMPRPFVWLQIIHGLPSNQVLWLFNVDHDDATQNHDVPVFPFAIYSESDG